MELTQLKYFYTVAQYMHFTRAAEMLHISQPSLSNAIAKLEDELGAPLFDRDSRNVRLNGYGQAFALRVRRILEELGEAEAELRDMRDGLTGSIHIASSFQLDYPGVLSEFIRSFYFSHPGLQLRVFNQDMRGMTGLLRDGRVDFAFSTGSFGAPDIAERELYSYRLGIVVCKSDPLAARDRVHMAELASRPFLSNNSSPDLNDSIYDICEKAGFEPKIAFECDNADLIGEAASRGLGLALASQSRFEHNNSPAGDSAADWKKELTFIPVEDDFCLRTTSVAYLKNRYQTAAARLFLKELFA